MIAQAPPSFDLKQFYEGIYLFQTWELFAGVKTEGLKDVIANLRAMDFPEDLTGKRVLDIAPWNGFFSFECARRNAAEVVSLGPEDPTHTGFAQTRDLLGLDNVRYVRGGVYDVSPEELGTFDIVLCLGLIYHLRHPLLALDRLYDVCNADFYIDSPVIDRTVFDLTVDENLRDYLRGDGQRVHETPLLYYTGASETGDAYNWFIPNRLALASMVKSSGFDVTRVEFDGGGWCWVSAQKGERTFEPGFEGYNPHAART